MAKLVILNQGMTGRTFEITLERTTVGRVEDNNFCIADGSVSSHHAEILLKGTDISVKDLGSTNGTFIAGEKISESVLKAGQILRFGQVELRIDDGTPVVASSTPPPASNAAPAPASNPAKKQDATMVIQRGVSLTELEQGGSRPANFNSNTAFSKKKSKINLYFIVGGIVIGIIIIGLIIVLLGKVHGGPQ